MKKDDFFRLVPVDQRKSRTAHRSWIKIKSAGHSFYEGRFSAAELPGQENNVTSFYDGGVSFREPLQFILVNMVIERL